ncbi:MAG: hypothetical protein K8R92_03415 [Planctomycetes bacterium]|nr:hypothetical protein [Planctomycetota bacterium]
MTHTLWTNLIAPALLAAHGSNSDDAVAGGIVAAALALGGFVCCGIVAMWFVVQGIICWFAYSAMRKVPVEHQQMAPGLIWLNLIPLFELIWNFFVFSKVPLSLQAALKARGQESGDCGQQLGLFYSIAALVSALVSTLPILNLACWVGTIVLCIMTLMAISEAARKLPEPPGQQPGADAL